MQHQTIHAAILIRYPKQPSFLRSAVSRCVSDGEVQRTRAYLGTCPVLQHQEQNGKIQDSTANYSLYHLITIPIVPRPLGFFLMVLVYVSYGLTT